jgi:hypothetical protein
VAEAADAARERVLVARAQLGDELVILEASARSAIDIPAKVKASPAKAAAVAGTAGFLVLGGPRRIFGGVRRVVRGPKAPMPTRMLPDEIEKTLSQLGSDGDAVRGVLERDFADYVKRAASSRNGLKTLLALAVVRPMLLGGSKATARWLFSTEDDASFSERLAQVKARVDEATHERTKGGSPASPGSPGMPPTGSPGVDTEDVAGA